MSLGDFSRISEQHGAYRKGLVLGLTMAEVGILIIFVLLLLLAYSEIRNRRDLGDFAGKEPIALNELKSLRQAEQMLQLIAKVVGIDPTTLPPDDFVKLVRSLETASTLEGASAAFAEMKQQIQEQAHKIANQEGLLRRYENKLAATGRGKDERPCWVRPDGTIDFLYDVALTSLGVRMREYSDPQRAAERESLPLPEVDPSEVLSEQQFIERTRPLYESSVANNCRFFVVIYDATAADEKVLYKRLLRTVEGHFYKRLDDGPPPF